MGWQILALIALLALTGFYLLHERKPIPQLATRKVVGYGTLSGRPQVRFAAAPIPFLTRFSRHR